MRPTAVLAALVFALVLALVVGARAGTQSGGTGVIVGRVVDAASGRPVAAAHVRAIAQGRQPIDTVLTGSDGQFALVGLPAGEFDVTAFRAGYLEGGFGRRRPDGSLLPLAVTEGERRGGIEIPIWPTASVSGQVFDDFQRPLPWATVWATRVRPGEGAEPEPTRSAVTDVGGVYRIDGLPPGRYLVGVHCRISSAGVPPDADPVAPGTVQYPRSMGDSTVVVAPDGGRFTSFDGPVRDVSARPASVYVTTWHGGATEAAQATVLELGGGDDRMSVDITMASRPAGRLAGRVLGLADGEQAIVRLFPPGQDAIALSEDTTPFALALAGDDGQFVLNGIAHGAYVLDAVGVQRAAQVRVSDTGVPSIGGLPRFGGRQTWRRTPVVVGRDEGTAAVLVALDPVTVSGTVAIFGTFPAGAGTPRLRLGRVSVGADGGRFEFTDVRPGWHRIDAPAVPGGWQLLSVQIAGREFAGLPFEVGSNGVTNATVTFGPATALTGTVEEPDRTPSDGTVVLFPADRAAWRLTALGNDRLRTHRALDGTFAFRGVPPGEYLVTAVDDAVLRDWPSPDLLSRLSARAARVMLDGGIVVTRQIEIDRSVR